ncbi:hypothetical protein M758_1G185500 [Ceratodon purpureus]|uniref:Uncharacterized protein n=1 Tax=Ceratodon purpureus TaxID=3225 RepID=A0A8T0JA63_CERPU|nr:hypothetical protein KC19_1G188900 [Ceratodon purpureus]KAG0630532.1 hypothetical protein M758_1G185500 [Ceratodon purpureus]
MLVQFLVVSHVVSCLLVISLPNHQEDFNSFKFHSSATTVPYRVTHCLLICISKKRPSFQQPLVSIRG